MRNEKIDDAGRQHTDPEGEDHVADRLLAILACHALIVAGTPVCSSVGSPARFVGLAIESIRTLIRPSSYQKGALR
ncbi:hypothetical protein GCM10010344_21970 [Streptomyces bluensis]|nr:hypothetical protein GCM10010344_21970 [Streptomyces bluensis]